MVSVSHIINKSNFTVRVSDRFFGAFWSRVMPFFSFCSCLLNRTATCMDSSVQGT